MNLYRSILLCVCSMHSLSGLAQITDSTHQLKHIEVSSSRSNTFSSGHKDAAFDSTMLDRYSCNTLSDLLMNESQIFVKSYGPGTLATTSFRGAGASHTAVIWNGFTLQSPMNGLLDVALVPASFLSDVKLQYGAAGTISGSGAVGGSIHLNNSSSFNKGISASVNASAGSFSDLQQQASVEISKERFSSSIRFFNHTAKNDYSFQNIAKYGFPTEKQTNADLLQHGLLQENYFQINEKQRINTRFWYQFNDRGIPPSMTQNQSISRQYDEAYRMTTEWQRDGRRISLFARAAYFDEFVRYNDPTIALFSKSETNVFIAEAETRFSITKFDLLSVGVNNTYSRAFADDFISDPQQDRIAVFALYKIHTPKKRWNAVIGARQEFIDGDAVPFVSSIGIEGNFLRFFMIKASAAQHYRIPTFNDLYWAQGGNPNLEPENGWSEEASLIHQHQFKGLSWMLSGTAFNRDIQNWIIWLPDAYGIWSPDNVMQVWSRGIEYKMNVNYSVKKLKISLTGNYNYIRSTNEKTAAYSISSLNKQLIYVPIQNAQGSISIQWRNSTITYTQVYTGYRYTTSDNTQYLKPYTTGNLDVSQSFILNRTKFKVYAQLNNLWDESYQVLAYRAMPLFNYRFGLAIFFNQPNKQTIKK